MRQWRVDVLRGGKLRCFGPDDKPLDERDLAADEIDRLVEDVEAGYETATPKLVVLGKRLYDWLDGPAQRWLAKARKGEPGLAVHIDVEERLRHLPWELMVDDGAFLCGLPNNPFTPVRRVGDTRRPQAAPANRPLRVLFMACSPVDTEPVLHFEDEEARILAATRQKSIELVVEESGSIPGLAERVSWHNPDYFDILHLTGHADVRDGQPCFAMETDVGKLTLATAEDIVSALGGKWPRLIFLSGCKTGQAVDQGALPSLAESMVAAGAPAVLGWALPVGDQWASDAAAELYQHLAVGMRIDEAVARARAKLFEDNSPYWHLLRLYADATELDELVTPLKTKGREKLHIRQAADEFIDAGAKSGVCPRALFVGRRRPLQRSLSVLRSVEGDDNYHEGVLLTGMGGLGKSSLATRLCERMSEHRRLVWVGKIDEAQLLHVLGDRLDDATVMNEPGMTLKQRLRGLLTAHLDKKPVLFVFDDFEQNVEGYRDRKVSLDDKGRAILTPEASQVLRDVLEAIRETSSDSRVIVTCRYDFPPPSSTAGLYHEALEHFEGADLDKKLEQLPMLLPDSEIKKKTREMATELGAGNPRLLERLNTVLEDKETDAEFIVEALVNTTAEFREDTLLQMLLDQQEPDCRKLLAMISVCHLPIDRAAVEAVSGEVPVDPHLDRAAALGLVEAGTDDLSLAPRYFVSGILETPLDDAFTGDEERIAASGRAARHLHEVWWDQSKEKRLERAMEVHRLAMISREKEIAVVIGDSIATHWIDAARFREAEVLCRITLELGEDYRILHTLARAEEVLGRTTEARQHYERALELCPAADEGTQTDVIKERAAIIHNLALVLVTQGEIARSLALWEESLKLKDQIGEVAGKAATLHAMAGVIAQQGNVTRAMELWEESLKLVDQAGEVRGKAATLNQMANVVAQQGDVTRALELWEESLKLEEQIGDVQGKAAVLHQMAGVIAQQGNVTRAMELWEESLKLEEQIGNVQGKAATLHQMAGVFARQGDVTRAMKLWEESLKLKDQIGDVGGKAATLHNMAWAAGQQGDVTQAMELWEESLKLEDQIGNVRGKAATLHEMAGVFAEQGNVTRAMELWEESLKLKEQIGDVQCKAATLHQMAGVIARQGDVTRAMELWEESVKLDDQIGDVQGKAATLHQMAGVFAEQGDVTRAMELWEESLKLKDQIGNVGGKAATLANMAWAAGQQGDHEREQQLNLEAARALGSIRAWPDLVKVLGNLGSGEHPDAARFIAQALWLVMRIEAPLEDAVQVPAAFVAKLGPEHQAAPLAATFGLLHVQMRGKGHPKQEELQQLAMNVLGACAEARQVPVDGFKEWFESERLNDPNWFMPALDKALIEIIGEDAWLFDPNLVAVRSPNEQ